ncbi:DNA-directed RNA polymerase subunit delta [Alicyclobacillus dauci]|uniref:Probable DNA-directed RNA polymerase subunit delta n=1 Tax=Alicyclobacillus dauci TaxID=1475485 RepID=A0ABY6Z1X2_9BACL|nr:DNA-directed RNA polymerase subunit delta [Alicyclobacillus dauci]WAH36889.1 DNA-directed RNA polymerase subunit delta [Alicyclobacillus dauci]
MAVTLTRPDHEIQQMPLVELAYEILKVKKEPLYFRDIMKEIQELRNLSEEEVNEVIARVFTEINIDGRFICIGQNVWGLNRWYPTDKVADRLSGKKFVRKTGDAFGDDDDDDEEYEDVDVAELDDNDFVTPPSDDEDEVDFDAASEDEEEAVADEDYVDDDEDAEEDTLYEEEDEEEEEED